MKTKQELAFVKCRISALWEFGEQMKTSTVLVSG